MHTFFQVWRRKARVITLVLASVVMSCVVMFALVLMAEGRAYYRQYLQERDLVAPLIAADIKFSHLKIHQRSNGGICLSGEVSSNDDLQSLKNDVIKKLGEERGREAVLAVSIKSTSTGTRN